MLIINNDSTDAYFNMAAEEYILTSFEDDCIMLWQNRSAVIVGKNQNTIEEINQDFACENGIDVLRRLSGGGAVYHDLGNVNFTFSQKYTGQSNFEDFTEPIVDYLKFIGVEAHFGGRNDILVCGKKISGNAQAVKKGKIMHHGTLLFSTDLSMLTKVLNPSRAKIESKGIKSTKSRVTNISDCLSEKITLQKFKEGIYRNLKEKYGAEEYAFSKSDKEKIRLLAEEKYRTWGWNYGESPKCDIKRSKRYDFGEVNIKMNIVDGKIIKIKIYGDFFGEKDISGIEELLCGCEYRRKSIEKTLKEIEITEFIEKSTLKDIIILII